MAGNATAQYGQPPLWNEGAAVYAQGSEGGCSCQLKLDWYHCTRVGVVAVVVVQSVAVAGGGTVLCGTSTDPRQWYSLALVVSMVLFQKQRLFLKGCLRSPPIKSQIFTRFYGLPFRYRYCLRHHQQPARTRQLLVTSIVGAQERNSLDGSGLLLLSANYCSQTEWPHHQ